MKRFTITFCLAAILVSCNDSGTTTSENKTDSSDAKVASSSDSKPKQEWVPVDSATAMKNMMEAGTPGQPHAMLAKSNGTWVGETTMWMAPDGPPMKMTTTSVNKMIMGGRYQHSTVKGDFMGQPFEGNSITAYDNARKVYTSTWYDNMSTGIMNMDGNWDDASKSIVFKGKFVCPANGVECEMKQVLKIIDDNTQLMEMYGPDMKTGKEFKNMEIKFVRKK